MAGRRGPIEISVERTLVPAGGGAPVVARLTTTLAPDDSGAPADPTEIRRTLTALLTELERATQGVGEAPAVPVRADRPLPELVETYRPRQRELIELLLADGELTQGEAQALRAFLDGGGALARPPPNPAVEPPPAPAAEIRGPIAAAPLVHDRTPNVPRPVPDLLSEYQIETLRQAGAVRARRQISYEEYMALKRHFASLAPAPSPPEGATSAGP